jgi:hypothetical protein
MDFKPLNNTQLVQLHEDLKELIKLPDSSPIFLGDATRQINSTNAIILSDARLFDVLQCLAEETYLELRDRFSYAFQTDDPAD